MATVCSGYRHLYKYHPTLSRARHSESGLIPIGRSSESWRVFLLLLPLSPLFGVLSLQLSTATLEVFPTTYCLEWPESLDRLLRVSRVTVREATETSSPRPSHICSSRSSSDTGRTQETSPGSLPMFGYYDECPLCGSNQ